MLLKGNLPPKMYNILPRNYLSYTFEFQLVLFVIRFILGDPFTLSPPKVWDFFRKNAFHGGQILWVKFIGKLFYMRRLMVRSYQGGRGFTNAFSGNMNTKYFPNHGGIFT